MTKISPKAVMVAEPRTIDSWTELENCPACGEDKTTKQFLVSIHVIRPRMRWVICEACGHVFASPRPSGEWLDAYYKRGYRMDTHESEDPENVPQVCGMEEMGRGVKIISDTTRIRGYKPFSSHLDVGSSTGALMAGVMERFTCTTSVGVEPNDAWRKFSENSFERFQNDPDKGKFVPAGADFRIYESLNQVPKSPKFEFISMAHVLEHVADPLEMLTRVAKHHLLSRGWVYIEVPNLYGGGPDPLLFPHLHAFTQETFRNFLLAAGLFPQTIETWPSENPSFYGPQSLQVFATRVERPHTKANVLEMYNFNLDHSTKVFNKMRQARVTQYSMG